MYEPAWLPKDRTPEELAEDRAYTDSLTPAQRVDLCFVLSERKAVREGYDPDKRVPRHLWPVRKFTSFEEW